MEPNNPQIMNQNFFQHPISLSDFNIMERLSMTAYGSVYKAIYKKNGKIYALKAKKQGYFKDQEKEKDYLREKEILYDLTKKNSHHVVKLYADFQDTNHRYLVLKFCDGTSLSKLNGNNPHGYVDQKLVIHILTQLLETLKYLHDTCHIIHREITPDNIILGTDNNIRIVGFGIAAYLVNSNNILVSNKSRKGQMQYAPPELIFFPPPLNYDYKLDIFSLGFTIYSLMNPSSEGQINLPKKTISKNNDIHRSANLLVNNFYDSWLSEFVELLYENDQAKRPTAASALHLLKGLQNDPRLIEKYNNTNRANNNNRTENNINNNNNAFMNNFNNTIPSENNRVTDQNNPLIEEPPQLNIVFDNRILSSMKCLLFVLDKLDIINFTKAQMNALFNNNPLNSQQSVLYSFYQILNVLKQWENGQISKENYEQIIINFIKNIFNNNNSGISGTRPIILLYMMCSIFKKEFQQNFNIYQNNIFDNIIKNNFKDFQTILPMNNQLIYDSISKKILDFQNNYKGPFVDQFYFLAITLSKCPQCGSLFGISSFEICQFLQLNTPNPENDIQNVINEHFIPKSGTGNKYNCQNCGCQGKKLRQRYCLNLPNYLFLELEDKNKVNFAKKIGVPLYNGQNYYYEYISSIYKFKNNETTSFCAVLKNVNNYYFYANDSVQQVPEKYVFLERPSLALYKKVSA